MSDGLSVRFVMSIVTKGLLVYKLPSHLGETRNSAPYPQEHINLNLIFYVLKLIPQIKIVMFLRIWGTFASFTHVTRLFINKQSLPYFCYILKPETQ